MHSLTYSPVTPVIITGAGSGIGRACAEALAEVGRPVAIWDLHQETLDPLAASLRTTYGVEVQPVVADVADPQQIRAGVLQSREALGAIGALVHAAGVSGVGELEALTQEQWAQVLDVNLRAEILLIQALLPDLRSLAGAAVVGIASINATLGNRMNPAYSASKGGLLAASRALADELALHGVRINAVSPGQIETPMLARAMDAAPGLREAFERRILLGRLGEPREVAAAVRFLLSDEASYITAAELVVDGGNISSQRA